MKNQNFNMRLDEETKSKLEAIASQVDKSAAEVVRSMIKARVEFDDLEKRREELNKENEALTAQMTELDDELGRTAKVKGARTADIHQSRADVESRITEVRHAIRMLQYNVNDARLDKFESEVRAAKVIYSALAPQQNIVADQILKTLRVLLDLVDQHYVIKQELIQIERIGSKDGRPVTTDEPFINLSDIEEYLDQLCHRLSFVNSLPGQAHKNLLESYDIASPNTRKAKRHELIDLKKYGDFS
jgi:chromosome segregation ATPase